MKVAAKDDPRKALADWMTAADNPYFARAMANWVWAQLFGKGLVDPPDDMSRANPPVHPELLDALAKHFVAAQVRPAGPDPDHRRFRDLWPVVGHGAGQRARHAAVLAPSAAAADGAPDGRRAGPGDRRAQSVLAETAASGTRRAIEVPDPTSASSILDTFGRCSRTVSCGSAAAPALTLRQALLLIGGDVIESKVSSLNGYLCERPEARARARGAGREPLFPDGLPRRRPPKSSRTGRPS